MKKVFEPCSLGALQLKNRIIRAATHEGMARTDGTPTEELLKTYQRLAAGGAGAIITGYAGVQQSGRAFVNMPLFDRDAYVDVYRAITDRLKPSGTPIILQLAHGGSRVSSKVTGQPAVGPCYRRKNDYGEASREASEAEIQGIIASFVRAIVNARKAGFDGVQLNAAHGWLLSEFISPAINRRSDAWGGSTEKRTRIVQEIVMKAREAVGAYPILVKFSAHDEHRRGMTPRESVAVAQILQQCTCDAVEVSCGSWDVFNTVRMTRLPLEAIVNLTTIYREWSPLKRLLFKLISGIKVKKHRPLHNYNADAAALIKQNVDLPVIVVGGIRNFREITEVITARNIDAVSLSRPFVIEPDIADKFRRGVQESSRCIDCGYCLIGVTGHPLRCYYGKLPNREDQP